MKQPMGWKQSQMVLLASAASAGIVLTNLPTTTALSRCPEIGRLPGIVIAMIVTTTIIHTLVTSVQADLVNSKRISAWYSVSSSRRLVVIGAGALLTAATLFLEILLWAWVYRHVGAIQDLEASLYFSGITFTTVGYGDLTLPKCWQLLSVGEAVNGVMMAGWSTALLIYLVQKMMTFRLDLDRPSGSPDWSEGKDQEACSDRVSLPNQRSSRFLIAT